MKSILISVHNNLGQPFVLTTNFFLKVQFENNENLLMISKTLCQKLPKVGGNAMLACNFSQN